MARLLATNGFIPKGTAGTLPEWWTIEGAYDNTQVVYAGNFKEGANLAAAIANLTGGASALSDPGGAATPTWASGVGITGDGLADYLSSNITPTNDQTWSMFVQYSGVTAQDRYLAGFYTAGTAAHFDLCADNTTPPAGVLYGSGQYTIVAPALAAGNIGFAGTQGYRNGTAEGAAIGAQAGAFGAIMVLCLSLDAVAGLFSDATITAFWIANTTITAPQAATLAAAMAAL